MTCQEVTPGRFNVFAHRGAPVVVFSTHLDTVPPALPVREDADWLYGRGAADAKGIAAAQIAAAERLHARGEDAVGLLFLVGEEASSDGAEAARHLGPKGRYLVNGEPTENLMALGTKGSIRFTLRVRGRTAHSAYPEEGRSAVDEMLRALSRIGDLTFPPDPDLGDVTINVGTIAGGTAFNVIPDECRAELMVRTVGDNDAVEREIRAAVGGDVEIETGLSMPAMRLRPRRGYRTTVVRFGTDLPWLGDWGVPYLMGPGSIRAAHTAEERVSKEALREGTALYERLASELLAEPLP